MKVVVASQNPVKRNAVLAAFETSFPDAPLRVVTVDVPSGVADQPMSDEETRRGAAQRAANARAALPDGDFFVGLEGGVEAIDGELTAFAWIVVASRDGRTGRARTVTLPLPPAVQELVDAGTELGDANDRVFATVDSKRKGGAFGLLTDGVYTRESVYTEAAVVALVPFKSALWNRR